MTTILISLLTVINSIWFTLNVIQMQANRKRSLQLLLDAETNVKNAETNVKNAEQNATLLIKIKNWQAYNQKQQGNDSATYN